MNFTMAMGKSFSSNDAGKYRLTTDTEFDEKPNQ